jgi:hypothetical protein
MLQTGMKCFPGAALHECRLWKAILEIRLFVEEIQASSELEVLELEPRLRMQLLERGRTCHLQMSIV